LDIKKIAIVVTKIAKANNRYDDVTSKVAMLSRVNKIRTKRNLNSSREFSI
jgi:hypothetical protein